MGPPGRFLKALSVLGAFAVGAGGGSLWRESANTCALTGVLLEDIRTLMVDGQSVVADPFLEHALGATGTFQTRIELERELAHHILARFGRFHLSLAFLIDLAKLPELEAGSLEVYLKGLENWRRTLHDAPEEAEKLLSALETIASPGAPGAAPGALSAEPWTSDPALARARLRELAHADHLRLDEARERIPSLKTEWAGDSQVYCRSMLTLHRMSLVQETQKEGCAKSSARKKASCAKAALTRFQAEIDELERVRSLNEKKLRLKWGSKLYAGFHCD